MKNKRIKFLIMPFLFLACTTQKNENCVIYNSGFSICQDTVFVDMKGEITDVLKYHNKFYILSKQISGYEQRWLYIVSNGKIEKVLDCPKKMDAVYLDFFVKNDSIILKQYMDKQDFYFDTQDFTWKEITNTDDLIFEDENFYVYSLYFGEWGTRTWFKEKKTGIEYMIATSSPPLINKIDTTYFLTNEFNILKIENPFKLNKCEDVGVTYRNIEKTKKYYSWYGEQIGFDIVYANKDTVPFLDDYTFIIPREINIKSSFVWQNELLHIQETDTATYIVKVENDSIIPIQKIEENLNFYKEYYPYRCRNLNGNNELLKFQTKDYQQFGLIEIIKNKVFIHYFTKRKVME